MKNFYITTPIYYPNGSPHIGHTYTSVSCDVIARYKRFAGYNVLFSTGTDEHGAKIEQAAVKAGQTPKQYVDDIVANFKKLWAYLNISYDRFVRTTDEYHIKTVQSLFAKLYDSGYIYKSEYKGKYCVPCESFWTESQLDKDGNCPDCNRAVTEQTEEAYFFRLSGFSDRLSEILTGSEFLLPKFRVAEMVNNFIKPGLADLCVSRSTLKWGISVPFDTCHTVYVWLDALVNYLSVLGYMNDGYAKDGTVNADGAATVGGTVNADGAADTDFAQYWNDGYVLHYTAKDIVRFHSIIWCGILEAAGIRLPDRLYSHGWITFGGKKMGKSVGNVVDPYILGDRYGVDAIRYQLLRDMPYGSDLDYSNELMLSRINTDLANNYGNLVSRTVGMVFKYFGGTLPAPEDGTNTNNTANTADGANNTSAAAPDTALAEAAAALRGKVEAYIDIQDLSKALEAVMDVVSRGNKYVDETMPWVLFKSDNPSDTARLAEVLYNLLEVIRITTVLLAPFMPTVTAEVLRQIGAGDAAVTSYENAAVWGVLPRDVSVAKGEILFPRIDIEKELAALAENPLV
ncbi:methionine--tRNA ligase [Clostridia bacterium]|nr:methionine--tRNA ligase [Clostridia bacterium]